MGGALVENILREETTSETQEEVVENVEIEYEDNVGPRKDVEAKNTNIPPLNIVLAQ